MAAEADPAPAGPQVQVPGSRPPGPARWGPAGRIVLGSPGLRLAGRRVPVAAAAAHQPGGWADRLSMMISMAGLSIAPYVLALLLIFIFAVRLQVLPAIGFVPLGQSVVGNIKSLTLPALAIGLPLACFY